MVRPVRVVVVDDHELYRKGLDALLTHSTRLAGAGMVADLSDLPQAMKSAPDVVLFGLHPDLIASVLSDYPAARIVVLSAAANATTLGTAMRAGALGLVGRDASFAELEDVTVAVLAGEIGVPKRLLPDWLASLWQAEQQAAAAVDLTPQQRAVLDLVAAGKGNREIAAALALSVATVKYHLARIYAALGVSNRVEAAVRGRSLVQPRRL